MIYLRKGQKMYENDGIVMYDKTGYYNDTDSVICAMVFAPEEPVCRYEAKFFAYGNAVYNITDPEQLLEEIKKIDPETLFGKNQDILAEQQMINSIQTTDSEDLSTSSETRPEAEPANDIGEAPLIVPDTASTTSDSATPETKAVLPNSASSTPSIEIPDSVSNTQTTTSTPSTISSILSSSTVSDISGTSTEAETKIEKIVPAIENVINQLNTISDIVESGTSTASGTTNLTL